jgi:hypothetical protein
VSHRVEVVDFNWVWQCKTYLADVESTVLKLVFYASVKAVACWLGFGFPYLKPKPKPIASQTFGLAWLDQATALASWLFGLKPSHGHHYVRACECWEATYCRPEDGKD